MNLEWQMEKVPQNQITWDSRYIFPGGLAKASDVFPIKGFYQGQQLFVFGQTRLIVRSHMEEKKSADILVLKTGKTTKEIFELACLDVDHWNEKRCLRFALMAVKFHGYDKESFASLIGTMGEDISMRYFEAARVCSELPDSLFQTLVQGDISCKALIKMSPWKAHNKIFFIEKLLLGTPFTASEQEKMAEWIEDMRRDENKDLFKDLDLVQTQAWQYLEGNGDGKDQKQRARLFFEAIRLARFPRLVQMEKEFMKIKRRIEQISAIRVEDPQGFERDGVELRISIRDDDSLETLEAQMKDLKKDMKELLNLVQ